MKKLLIIFIINLIVFQIKAQHNTEYIHISVTDTIQLNPSSIIFLVGVEDAELQRYNFMDMENPNKNMDQYLDEKELINAEAEKRLKQILDSLGFKYELRKEDDLSLSNYSNYKYRGPKKTYRLELHSFKEVRELVTTLKPYKHYAGEIINLKVEDETNINDILLKKAYKKAKEKATFIAEMTNVKLGGVIQFRDTDYNGKEYKKSSYKNTRWRDTNNVNEENIEKIIYTKTINVTFKIQN